MQILQQKDRVIYVKKWIIISLIVLIFALSVVSGFLVRSFINFSSKKEHANPAVLAENNEDEIIDTSSSDITVSPNAEVVLTQKYKGCGHTVTKREIAPREIINLNKDRVQEFYEGWNIDEFNANEIKLSRSNKGICDEHYILRESDGYISISCRNNSGEYIFKGLTDISVQYLTEEDLAKLEQGIEVVGRDALNKFLEDYE